MNANFVELNLGSHIICHGYDKDNKEILEEVNVDKFSRKIISVSRIKSVSDKFILTDYVDGRWIYWEYQENYELIKELLIK